MATRVQRFDQEDKSGIVFSPCALVPLGLNSNRENGIINMNLLIMAIGLTAGSILEKTLPLCVFLGQAKAPILMGIVLYYALNRPAGMMLGSAVAGGVLCDGLSGLPLGYSSLCFCVLGSIAYVYRDIAFTGKWVTHAFFGAIGGLALTLAMYVFLLFREEGVRAIPLSIVCLKSIGTGLLGAIFTPALYIAMTRLDRLVGNITPKVSEHGFNKYI